MIYSQQTRSLRIPSSLFACKNPIPDFTEEQIAKAKEVTSFLTVANDRYANQVQKNSFKNTIFC